MKPVQKEEPKKDIKPHDSDLLNRTLNSDISAGTEETDVTLYKQNATEEAHTKHKTSNLQCDPSFNWETKEITQKYTRVTHENYSSRQNGIPLRLKNDQNGLCFFFFFF